MPFDGAITNYVNLNWYLIGFEFGLNIVKGKLEVWLIGQNPKS